MLDTMFENPTDELIHIVENEVGNLKSRMEEIEQQIHQYEQMVKREEKRNAEIATSVQVMKSNIESMPREDIQTRYDEAIDVNFRLATMRGQLEQLKGNHEIISAERKLLSEVLSKLHGGITLEEQEEDPNPAQTAGSLNIIRIVQAQEDERRRLANQMHDGPAQSLTNFVLQAEIVQRLFDRDQETAKEELVNLKESANVTFQRVRDFISDLRPMMLDDLGFLPTARRYIEAFSNKSGIKIEANVNGAEDRRMEEYQEVMLFRGLQDLMAHARDFADATEIIIDIDVTSAQAIIRLEDNGRSFDAEALMNEEHPDDPRTQGIITLQDRFALVGGEVAVTGGEGEHTTVKITMSVSDRE